MAFKYQNGVYVRDKVTGFEGVICARKDSLTGCNQYAVHAEVRDGKLESFWFDEHSLEVNMDKQQLKLHREVDQPPG